MKKSEIIETLRLYKKVNIDKYKIQKIGIFGSAARDCMNDDSDIDIVVELGKP